LGNRYIVEAILHNYRGYDHCVVPFTDGLNVIYGEGDAGKSALEKALRWCLLNEKQGKYVNKKILTPKKNIKSNEEVYVQVTFNTGEVIRRASDSTTPNMYYIGNVNTPFEEWGDPIKNFNDVPEDVFKITNMNSINVGKQFDSHFLLSSKGGDIAKELNKLVNLEIIDSSTSNVNHFVSKVKKEKEALELNIAKYETELQSYSYLDDMEKALIEVEELNAKVEKLRKGVEDVKETIYTIQGVEAEHYHFSKVAEFKSNIEAIQALQEKTSSLSIDRGKVDSSLSQLRENGDLRAKYEGILSHTNRVAEITVMESTINELTTKYNAIGSLVEKADVAETIMKYQKIISFSDKLEELETLGKTITGLNQDYDTVHEQLETIESISHSIDKKKKEIEELKNGLEGVCPLCGQPIKEDVCC